MHADPLSGPTAGMSEVSAGRIRELEAALDFLLGIPEVRASLESTIQVRGSVSQISTTFTHLLII